MAKMEKIYGMVVFLTVVTVIMLIVMVMALYRASIIGALT